MNYLSLLDQAVRANLASGRVGTPVFVRMTGSIVDGTDHINPALAALAVYAGGWLQADLRSLYANGNREQGHVSLALTYTTGSSALLALALSHGRPHMDLAIYGNRGAVYHKEHIVASRDGEPSGLEPDKSGRRDNVRKAIEQSLTNQQPVIISELGGSL